ncbi:MAG: hypothetical protein IKD72_00420 [Clostridia bacterium]|nr:hypothetical protein [Clostridia bacterium]
MKKDKQKDKRGYFFHAFLAFSLLVWFFARIINWFRDLFARIRGFYRKPLGLDPFSPMNL